MAPKRKRRLWIWILAALVFLAGVGFWWKQKNNDERPVVTTQTLERATLVSKVNANGKVEAERKVDLSADIMGQIVNLAVREGDRVAKGDFLLQIDQTQHEASAQGAAASLQAMLHDRDAARATEVVAQQNFERASKSHEDELIPVSELDRAQAELDSATARVAALDERIAQARATLRVARDTLSKTKIVAPISGTVTALPVEEGEVAVIGTMNNPGTVLMTISDMSAVEAVMEVDETDIPFVKLGQRAEVTVDAYGDERFDGVVTEVGSSPIQTTANEAINFEVKIRLSEPPESIRPGFSCSAEIITDTRDEALAAPMQALVVRERPADDEGGRGGEEEEGVYVYQSDSGTVQFTAVETGISDTTRIEIVSGLDEGQEVVTGPFRVLREIGDGDEVKLEEAPNRTDKAEDSD